jgi:hypothetical protein
MLVPKCLSAACVDNPGDGLLPDARGCRFDGIQGEDERDALLLTDRCWRGVELKNTFTRSAFPREAG